MQNSKFNLKFVFAIALSFSLLVLSSSFSVASAQTPTQIPTSAPAVGINLTLSPTFLNLRTDPGKEVNAEFKLRNNNNFPENLRLSIIKFVTGPTGNPLIADVEEGDEFAKWVSFEDSDFTLSPGQNKTVKFKISPPSEAALGYYYGIQVSRVRSVEEGGETGTVISGSTALPVLLEVRSPNAKREIQITEFKTDRQFLEYLPVKFHVTFKNSGNVHISPAGDVFVDSLWSDNVAVIKMNEGRGNVLPQGVRTFTTTWEDGFAVRKIKTASDGTPLRDDQGNSIYETKYDFSKANLFRFGRYTANLLMVYDNGERDIPIEAKVSFWIVPWKILGITLVILIFAFIGIRSSLKSTWRRFRRNA